MPAFDEETFGPVAAVIRVKDETDAGGLANDSVYGLGASLRTRDLARAERLGAQIEAGAVFVNGALSECEAIPLCREPSTWPLHEPAGTPEASRKCLSHWWAVDGHSSQTTGSIVG